MVMMSRIRGDGSFDPREELLASGDGLFVFEMRPLILGNRAFDLRALKIHEDGAVNLGGSVLL